MKRGHEFRQRIAALVAPGVRQPVEAFVEPFRRFVSAGESGGVVLIAFTALALIWANSPWNHSYHELWETQMSLQVGSASLDYSLHHWINDGLMALFFFYVGLEIKR